MAATPLTIFALLVVAAAAQDPSAQAATSSVDPAHGFKSCPAGTAGRDCAPCPSGTFSWGGFISRCKPCICKRFPNDCQEFDSCDATTSKCVYRNRPNNSTCTLGWAKAKTFHPGPGFSTKGVCLNGTCVAGPIPPPPDNYCCSGNCRIPVARPPSFEELPPLPPNTPVTTSSQAQVKAAIASASASVKIEIDTRVQAEAGTSASEPTNLCTANGQTRVWVGTTNEANTPKAQGQGKVIITTQFRTWPPNGATAACTISNPCGPNGCTGTCSGNTISSGLVLTAAHCFDFLLFRRGILAQLRAPGGNYPANADPCNIGGAVVDTTRVFVCYNYDNTGGNGGAERCSPRNTFLANGASWYARPADAPNPVVAPYDYAIIFLAAKKVLPSYYQYNYLDNYPANTPVQVENWSYIGTGCTQCNIECRLSHIGPATFTPSATLGTGPSAVKLPLTSLPGNSGSCSINTPDQCCFGVSSFSENVNGNQCGTDCRNFYSPIMAERPLTTLWSSRQVVL